jgi:hypothetical protein
LRTLTYFNYSLLIFFSEINEINICSKHEWFIFTRFLVVLWLLYHWVLRSWKLNWIFVNECINAIFLNISNEAIFYQCCHFSSIRAKKQVPPINWIINVFIKIDKWTSANMNEDIKRKLIKMLFLYQLCFISNQQNNILYIILFSNEL